MYTYMYVCSMCTPATCVVLVDRRPVYSRVLFFFFYYLPKLYTATFFSANNGTANSA